MRIYNQNIWGNMKSEHRIANRNLLIRALISAHAPDVCGFQECNPKTSRAGDTPIESVLSDSYAEVLPENADRNFTPLFYNRASMNCIDCGWFLFDGKNDKNSKSVTWAILEEQASGKRAAFFSIHFWWKWESEEDTLQRRENARQLANFCKDLAEKYPVPFFVMGDLNSGIGAHQGEDAYLTMRSLGMRDLRELAKETTSMQTAHEYPVLNEEGNYVGGGQPYKTLDYVFNFGAEPLSVDRFLVLTEEDALNSSDHCPLVVDVRI